MEREGYPSQGAQSVAVVTALTADTSGALWVPGPGKHVCAFSHSGLTTTAFVC